MHRRTLFAAAAAIPAALTLPGTAYADHRGHDTHGEEHNPLQDPLDANRAQETDGRQRDQLQQLLEAEHAAGMPGVFAEVHINRHREGLAAGVADIDSGRPVRPWFRHRVGSITKSFVSVVVLQLAGEGRLRLDDPIAHYLPQYATGAITIRQLLNHTSGLGNYTDALLTTLDDLITVGQRTYRPDDLIRIALNMPPTGPPGGVFSYTNTGYIFLGLLIEKLTGRRYGDEVRRRILQPLHLDDSYLPGNSPRIQGPHSQAYVPWTDGSLRDFSVYNMTWAWAAGELISTPHDINTFYRALLGGRLLSSALLREMQTANPLDPTAPEAGGYGLGLYFLSLPDGQRAWGHDGGTVGHVTISLHTARDVTSAENMAFYFAPPIDQARVEFFFAALGVTAPAAARLATPFALRLMPDVRLAKPSGTIA